MAIFSDQAARPVFLYPCAGAGAKKTADSAIFRSTFMVPDKVASCPHGFVKEAVDVIMRLGSKEGSFQEAAQLAF
jgi:hypothetical protein